MSKWLMAAYRVAIFLHVLILKHPGMIVILGSKGQKSRSQGLKVAYTWAALSKLLNGDYYGT